MVQTTFKTNPVPLEELLKDCGNGKIQLPDFQRSWVWDEDRIKGLLASVSQAFPIGALMTLEMKAGAAETFARRPIEGADHGAESRAPDALLLDGQQRMTSLYQTCLRNHIVATITARQKLVRHWFYIDIIKALSSGFDREETILGIPEDRKVKENFDRDVVLDLSTPEAEYRNLMFPLNRVFDWDEWQDGFGDYWIARNEPARRELFKQFKNEILANFKGYQVPVIALAHDTSHEAVCLVFEKVNTGGKALDAFELVTAMYAAQGYRLRDDWYGTLARPAKDGKPAEAALIAIETPTGAVRWKVKVGSTPAGVLWHNGKLLVGIMGGNYVAMIDPTDGRVERKIQTGRGAHVLFAAPDRKAIYVSNRVEGTISVLDPDSLKVLRSFPIAGGPDDMDFAPDGNIWASRRWAHSIAIINAATGNFQSIDAGRSPHGIWLNTHPN
jgi:Protein of unknown function DUF262